MMMKPKSFMSKTILVASKGEFPAEGSLCKLIILDYSDNGLISQSIWIKKDGINTVTIGEADCEFDYGLEHGLIHMNQHEKSVIELQINGNTCKITVEILEFSKSVPFFRLDASNKLEIGLKHKHAGIRLFKISRVREAFLRFSKSMRYIVALKEGGKASEEVQSLYRDICNNMALCQLQVGNHELVVTLCGKVLSTSPSNIKALYRRAEALTQLKLFDQAAGDLRMIISLEPSNKVAVKKLEYVENALAKQEKNYVDMVKRMCSFR